MTTVKVDIGLLKKYFLDHYDFTNDPGSYFKMKEYDLESGSKRKLKPVYEDIQKLCNEYGLESHTDTLFNLFIVSRKVRFLNDHARIGKTSHRIEYLNEIQYKKDLFSLFLSTVNENQFIINSLIVSYKRKKSKMKETEEEIKKEAIRRKKVYEFNMRNNQVINSELFISVPASTLPSPTVITREKNKNRQGNKFLLDKFRTFILDEVAELYFNKKWIELNSGIDYEIDEKTERIFKNNEVTTIIDDVNEWMDQFGNSDRGAPGKTIFLKHFIRNINIFLKNEINCFRSERQRHGFLGQLLVIYQIFPSREKETLIKAVENHLPKK